MDHACPLGLQQLGFTFELKGGTSLSKGYGLIHRFSEDIDILIHPDSDDLPIGKNQNKPAHVEARRQFYDSLARKIVIPGFTLVERDDVFDDARMRSAGIRLHYQGINDLPEGVKDGILLETGFDQVAPNRPCQISSWAYDKAHAVRVEGLTDNRPRDVPCYEPGYTLVEKLQTISTKFRRYVEDGSMPQNFLRHYYDVYCLLQDPTVQAFIGTEAYHAHKGNRFPAADEKIIAKNAAFRLDAVIRESFGRAYRGTAALYYKGQPSFESILQSLGEHIERL